MNSYELVLIFDADLGEEKTLGIISKVEDKIKNLGGELEKTDKWGARRLASRIKKAKNMTQAYYVVIYFKSASSLPAEIQNYLKVTENIVRYSVNRAIPKLPAETEGAPLPEGQIEAVNVGEIKGAEGIGES